MYIYVYIYLWILIETHNCNTLLDTWIFNESAFSNWVRVCLASLTFLLSDFNVIYVNISSTYWLTFITVGCKKKNIAPHVEFVIHCFYKYSGLSSNKQIRFDFNIYFKLWQIHLKFRKCLCFLNPKVEFSNYLNYVISW